MNKIRVFAEGATEKAVVDRLADRKLLPKNQLEVVDCGGQGSQPQLLRDNIDSFLKSQRDLPESVRGCLRIVVYQPVYLRVPPGHEKNWRKHCQRYNACGRPVYFVQDTWYTNVYAPQYRAEHGGGKGHKGNNGHDNGKGHDKGNKGKGHD